MLLLLDGLLFYVSHLEPKGLPCRARLAVWKRKRLHVQSWELPPVYTVVLYFLQRLAMAAVVYGPLTDLWRMSSFKGTRSEGANWLPNVENVQIFPSVCFDWLFYQYLFKWSAFSGSNLSSPGRSHVGSPFTSSAHAGLVYDVTDTDCWVQNGRTHGHVFITFKHLFLTNRNGNWVKTITCLVFIPLVSTEPAMPPRIRCPLSGGCWLHLLTHISSKCFAVVPPTLNYENLRFKEVEKIILLAS